MRVILNSTDTVGWDRVMNTFFLQRLDADGECVLDEGDIGDQIYSLAQFEQRCDDAKFVVPSEGMSALIMARDLGSEPRILDLRPAPPMPCCHCGQRERVPFRGCCAECEAANPNMF